jgi:diguanylate cyclase (GGDEF)-like protein/PAS domain S-box-containing protein
VLADWRRSAIVQASVAGGLTAVLVVALLLLAREIERRQGADAQIRASGERYRLLAESTTDVIVWSDLNTTRRYVSPAVRSVLGYEPEEVVGTRPLNFVHPDDVAPYQSVLVDLTEGRTDQAVTTLRYRSKYGDWVWIEASFKLTRDPSGAPTGYVAALRDVTDRRAAEEKLRLSEERLSLALNSGSDGLWDWDLATGAVQFSDNWFEMLGYGPGEIEPHIRAWNDFVHPDDEEHARRLMVEHVKGLTPTYECEYRMRQKTGGYVWTLARGKVVSRDETGRAMRIVGTHMDITRRKEAEQQIAHMAMHDGLTGLANRVLFREKLEQALATARRQGDCFAILACDLDRFKAVNDTLGHPAGDALLRAIADRLRAVVRDGDTIARLGGDEFAIIVRGLDDRRSVGFFAQRVIEAVGQPVDLDGHAATVSVSIGIALGTETSTEAEILFKHADTALYRAKAVGRNGYSFYDPSADSEAAKRSLLERDLRDAVRRGGFVLHYQPIVAMADETVGGFEALLRWQHPTRGAISPSEFIPLAEETGLIIALGEWAIREACHEAASWQNDLRVAVNVSAVQFQQPGLEQVILDALVASGLSPHRLELEITESMLMQDSEAAVASLHRLKGLGVRIALDDFGTGFSSLSYLRRFPFDKIKIDRSFIRDIGDPDTAAIVRAIVGIGARLGATVTAEGVETREQLEQVRREGCTEVQGFLYSKPVAVAEALAFALTKRSKAA